MSQRRMLRLAAVVMAASAAVFVPTTAHAERVTVVDAAGDAEKLDWERSGKDDPVFLPAPDETSVDIVRTVVAHGRARLAVSVRFRDLARLSEHETSMRVMSPSGDRFDLRVATGPGGGVRTVATLNDRSFSCRGLRAVLDGDLDRIGVSLPTACVGAPPWVRVGVTADGVEDTSTEEHPDNFEMYVDDGHSDTLDPRNWPVLGPRVRRG